MRPSLKLDLQVIHLTHFPKLDQTMPELFP